MDSERKSLRVIAPFLLGVGATLTLMALYRAADLYLEEPVNDLRFANGGYETVNVSHREEPFQDLAPLLKRVATEDRTLIMTAVNWAWAKPDSLLDHFLQSFTSGEKIDHFLKHLLIVAFDSPAFDRCKLVHPYCYHLKVNGDLSGQQKFLSKGYLEIVWTRLRFEQSILEQGYNFLYTDVDIMWFRNPLKHITVYADMTTSADELRGDPDDINKNLPNMGFFHVKSSNRSIEMMKYWQDARKRFPPHHDQFIFKKIKQDIVDSLGVKIQSVDTKYFGGFCNFTSDLSNICTMHANCCPNGLEAKISDLKSIMVKWKNYTSLSIEEKKKFTWRKPGQCRL